MYQPRVRFPFKGQEIPQQNVDEAMWQLFVAVGDFWKLGDEPSGYRSRFSSFMVNRSERNPLYQEFYRGTKDLIDGLVGKFGRAGAYEQLFTQKDRKFPPPPPETELEFIQQYVVNEFVALRLALGGFKAFGGINYCGYFGGANIADQPVPYRPMGKSDER